MFNSGKFNEIKIAHAIDGQKVSELSRNFKYIFETVYGALDKNKYVVCKKMETYKTKPDVYFEYNGIRKYISIKKGRSKSVHGESLELFIKFLRENGVSEQTLKTIVLIHYGDKTYNGTGKKRYDYATLYSMYRKHIKKANEELNSNQDLVVKFAERALSLGIGTDGMHVDYVYYGDDEYGEIVSLEKIIRYVTISYKKWNFYNSIHIGPIIIHPHARYVDKEIRKEKLRHEIACDWPNFGADIEYLARRYGGH